MKEEGLKNYFSNILQIDYRFNSIYLRIVDLISYISSLFSLLLRGNLQEYGEVCGVSLTCEELSGGYLEFL